MPEHEKVPGTRSIERLSHFRCGHCNKWFSVGDAPTDRTEWFCPWCGTAGVFLLTQADNHPMGESYIP